MTAEDYSKSLALLIADGIRFTETLTDEHLDDVILGLEMIVRGSVTNQDERNFFKRMLDNGWTVTAPFNERAYS